jgi:hypothetical protein
MYKTFFVSFTIGVLSLISCDSGPSQKQAAAGPPAQGSFGYDLAFIRHQDSGALVLQRGEAKLLISPKYQAKVFTSTATGDTGPSFGWIHYKAFGGPQDPHMNAYGGENRLWLGPEGGRFSLYFARDAKMDFAHWKTPAAFDTEPWRLAAQTPAGVRLEKDMQLTNYHGTALSLLVTRNISIFSSPEIDKVLKLGPDSSVHAVGYRTENLLTNKGKRPWTEASGMPCLWLLDMFNPSPSTTIFIPYGGVPKDTTRPATTDYFGEIPGDRIRYTDGKLFFKADGKSRGKLGMHPIRARPVAGSYDAKNQVLTIILFDVDPSGRYLNQEWNIAKPPFSGDAVNAYNDGPLADGSQMGPFYELESVSQAAFLQPGASLAHQHCVFHFTGAKAGLDKISRRVLGVTLEETEAVFRK